MVGTRYLKRILLWVSLSILILSNFGAISATPEGEHLQYITVLYDNFDDNSKNYTIWTEIYKDGIWDEINHRAEFELTEDGSCNQEGIESISFNVNFSETQGLIVNWTLITDIGSTSRCGAIYLVVTDETGKHWIEANYWRWRDLLIYKDSSNDNYTILKRHQYDGEWDNTLIIYADKYRLRMNDTDSGWINRSIFPPQTKLKIQIYIRNCGSTPGLIHRSAFDNIEVLLIKRSPAITISWTYPPSYPFLNQMHRPYGIVLNVSNNMDMPQNFTFGLNYTFTPYNLLGIETSPDWDLGEKSFCILSNLSTNEPYFFNSILNTTIAPNETKTWKFTVYNRWNWIEPWSMERILAIVYSIVTAGYKELYSDLCFSLDNDSISDFVEIISTFVNAIWHLKYNYQGLGSSSNSSSGTVDVWIPPEKLIYLVESIASAHLASMATSKGFCCLVSPLIGWYVAAAFFILQGTAWVLSEIAYAASVDPDYNFTNIAKPDLIYIPTIGNLSDTLSRNISLTAVDLLSAAEAKKTSYSRYLGAIENSNEDRATMQLAATIFYTQMEIDLLQKLNTYLEELIDYLPPVENETAKTVKDNLASQGLPRTEIEVMKYLGYSDKDLEHLLNFYKDVNLSFYLDYNYTLSIIENLSHLLEILKTSLSPPSEKYLIASADFIQSRISMDNLPENISCYIEFNNPGAARGLYLESCKLNDNITPTFISYTPSDYDNDGLPDFLVIFNTSDLLPLLDEGKNIFYLSGNVTFSGRDHKIYYCTGAIDLTGAPPVTCIEIGTPTYNNWISSSTPLWLNATDNFSGVKYTICEIWKIEDEVEKTRIKAMMVEDNSRDDLNQESGNISIEFNIPKEGDFLVRYYSVDYAANIEDVHEYIFSVDNTPPTSSISIGEPCFTKEMEIWISPETQIHITAKDTGCGVKEIWYTYDGGEAWYSVEADEINFTIPEECTHKVIWYAVDFLNNSEKPHYITLNVDAIPPQTKLTVGDPHVIRGNATFVTSHTDFTFIANDIGNCSTGVKAIWYRVWNADTGWSEWRIFDPRIISIDGIPIVHGEGKHHIEYYSEDFLLNKESIHNFTCYVDDMPPKSRAYCDYPRFIYIEAEDIGDDLTPAVGGYRIHYRYMVEGENWTEWQTGNENENVVIHLTWPGNTSPITIPIHLEYYAVDALNNTETIHHDTFYLNPDLMP